LDDPEYEFAGAADEAVVKRRSTLSHMARAHWFQRFSPSSRTAKDVDPAVRHLWILYKDAAASVSKTYAPNGTYALHKSRRGICFAELTQVNSLPSRQTILPRQRISPVKEHAMMDVIMLAIGLGFFALSVGYVVACDRL
jgi:hypothetical protein